jgi:hypothetical protein
MGPPPNWVPLSEEWRSIRLDARNIKLGRTFKTEEYGIYHKQKEIVGESLKNEIAFSCHIEKEREKERESLCIGMALSLSFSLNSKKM